MRCRLHHLSFTNVNKTLFVVVLISSILSVSGLSAQSWKFATGSNCPNGLIESSPVAVDGAGNIYETGLLLYPPGSAYTGILTAYFGSISIADSGGAFLASTDSNGVYRWVLPVNGNADFTSLTTDPYGNIYLLGICYGSGHFTFGSKSYSSGYGYFCIKVDSSGDVLWIKSMAQHACSVNSIIANTTGDLYISGVFGSNLGGVTTFAIGAATLTNTDPTGMTNDVFFAKFDSSGNPLWAKSFGGIALENQTAFALTSGSGIYVAGFFCSPSMIIGSDTIEAPGWPSPFFVAKFDGAGNSLWARAVPANDTFDYINSIATDPNGSVYLTGVYAHNFSFGTDTLPVPLIRCMFLAKYDSSGNAKWGRSIPDLRFFTGNSVAADACGNIWVSGESVNFTNTDQLFLAEYDSAGYLADTLILSDGGDDATALVVDKTGNLIIGGDYEHSPSVFGSDTLTYTDSSDEAMFVLKYNYSPGGCIPGIVLEAHHEVSAAPEISFFPNPATEECTVHTTSVFAAGSRIELYDITGRLIGTYALSGNNTTVSLSGIVPGMYACRIYNKGYLTEIKKLVVMK